MTPTEQDRELQNWLVEHTALIEEIGGAVWRELELETFMYHLRELITADRKRVALEARLDELDYIRQKGQRIVVPGMEDRPVWSDAFRERIAELKKGREQL